MCLCEKIATKEHRETLTAIRQKHAEIADAIGTRVDEDRMRIYKGVKSAVSSTKDLKNGGDGGIIKENDIQIGKSIGEDGYDHDEELQGYLYPKMFFEIIEEQK